MEGIAFRFIIFFRFGSCSFISLVCYLISLALWGAFVAIGCNGFLVSCAS